jgi:hypothetical protein
VTWKEYARQRHVEPLAVWRHAIPNMRDASPAELHVLWDGDDAFREWLMAEIDVLADAGKVPM